MYVDRFVTSTVKEIYESIFLSQNFILLSTEISIQCVCNHFLQDFADYFLKSMVHFLPEEFKQT